MTAEPSKPRVEIEAPEVIAIRLSLGVAHSALCLAMRADREQIRAWCIEHAEEAEREAAAHDVQEAALLREGGAHGRAVSHRERVMRCEGQAVVLRGLAAMLGGGK